MNHYRMLPAARVGMGAVPPLPMMRRGFGDALTIPTTTIVGSTAVDSALTAMVSDIATNGCKQTRTPSVSAFQNAYNSWLTQQNATSSPVTGAPATLTVDGLYGTDSNAAATFINTQDGLNLTIPAGCVGTGGGSSGSSSSSTATSPSSSSTVNVSSGSPYVPYLVAGAVVATGLVGYAVWHHEKNVGRRAPARHLRLSPRR